MVFADAHCHLDFEVFDFDRRQLIERCGELGVKAFIIPGVRQATWDKVLSVSAQYSEAYPCLGLHPYYIEQHVSDDIAVLERKLSRCKDIVAVGEIGLDLTKPHLKRQIQLFEQQVELANAYRLPVVMHSRKTHHLILEVLKRKPLVAGGMLHGFSGSYEQGVAFCEAGVYLGVGGVITYARAKKTQRAFSQLPLTKILLETDSPDMPLSGMQGERNTPLNIPLIHKEFCELRTENKEDITRQLMRNVSSLFGIMNT